MSKLFIPKHANNLKYYRMEKEIDKATLAIQSGVLIGKIKVCEAGNIQLSSSDQSAIAKILDASVEEIFGPFTLEPCVVNSI